MRRMGRPSGGDGAFSCHTYENDSLNNDETPLFNWFYLCYNEQNAIGHRLAAEMLPDEYTPHSGERIDI